MNRRPQVSVSGEVAAMLLNLPSGEAAYERLGRGRTSYGFQSTDPAQQEDVFILCADKEEDPPRFWLSLNGFS